MYNLDKMDIGWIFAFKRGQEIDFYKRHYYRGVLENHTPSKGLLGSIVFWILVNAKGWNDAMYYLKVENGIINIIEEKEEYTFNEIYYWAFKYWTSNLTIKKIEELCPHYEEFLRELGELG